MKKINVLVVGNPNCGKTTLFNALTGSKLKVANWPGVTVEKKEATIPYEDYELTLIDTPGIYSLTSYSIEEKVTRKALIEDEIDVVLNILDASSLERNLYLTLQLLEFGKPVVIALNMMDIISEQGMEIDLHRLPELLSNMPVVPVSATKKHGIDILLHAIVHHYEEQNSEISFHYSKDIEACIDKIEVMMSAHYPEHDFRRWHAIKLLEGDEDVSEEHPIPVHKTIPHSYETKMIEEKYQYIEMIVKEVLFHKERKSVITDHVDRFLTGTITGPLAFLAILCFVFLLTFSVGDFVKQGFEIVIEQFSNSVGFLLDAMHVHVLVKSLVVDGIIAGVGGILTFLPNIIILFIALAILEDSGYMSRVAYVMDAIMGKVGLSGKAFLPMILGFGCSVPAIMATRTLEQERDRKRTMFITPFMSCSAKLPIYVLFADMFFGKFATIAAFSMYVMGVLIAILVAFITHKCSKDKSINCLLIELPEYKKPNVRSIRIYVWGKVKDYLIKAGTTIFLASIIIWGVLNLGPSGFVDNPRDSFGAMIGHFMVPILKPAGLGMWEIGVALISGLSAKEVVVSSLHVLLSSGAQSEMAKTSIIMEAIQTNIPGFNWLNALSFMAFSLLYVPCAATVATIQKESKSWKFTAFVVLFQLGLAYLVSVLIYQLGSLIF